MQFRINPTVIEKFSGVEIGLVIAHGVNNRVSDPSIANALAAAANDVRRSLTVDQLTTHPHIATWREAYRAFGAKPKEHRSSIENLCRLVLNGKPMHSINSLVDLYNIISLKYLLPLGGEDLTAIAGDVELTLAGPTEPPVVLLGDHEAHVPHPGEVIYKDAQSAICRRWNWREANRTKLTEQTSDCILVIEAIPPIPASAVDQAADELCCLIKRYCGGTTTYQRLNRGQLIGAIDYSISQT